MATAMEDRLLTIADVAKLVRCSVPSLKRWIADGRFPAGMAIGPRLVRWRERTILAYLEKREREAGNAG